MSKESRSNAEGFGTHKQRHEGGQDPEAAKRRRTGNAGQGTAENTPGSHDEDRTLGREAGRRAGETRKDPA
jgi:general stress protein YciG